MFLWVSGMERGLLTALASSNINLRVSQEARELSDQAARALGRNRSEFMLEVAQERAREVLLDRTRTFPRFGGSSDPRRRAAAPGAFVDPQSAMGGVTYSRPELLQPTHRLDTFSCADSSLEHWLQHLARKNHAVGGSRVFVVLANAGEVAGYYALAAGSVARAPSPGRVRRNMPDPVPVAVLGRLAVYRDHTGMGIGSGLLKDAVLRVRGLSDELGVRALLCHAINHDALGFYLHHGFIVSPVEPMTVVLPLG